MNTSFFYSLPKIELHNHLEGTITPQTFHVLAKKNDSESMYAQSIEECQKLYEFSSFQGFLYSFSKVNSFIKQSTDLDIIIQNTVIKSKEENYRYVEYFISLDTFMKKGMSLIELLDRLKSLRKHYSNYHFIIGGFIIDFVRNYGPTSASNLLDDLIPVIDDYRDVILGISIGGDEIHFPAPPFKELFSKARALGLKTTAHAGEANGPESIWDTILTLKTDRIGHGLRSYESLDLLKHFRVTQTHVEMCPTSNVKTGLISSLQHHPLQTYLNQGFNFSINTDDSGFFNTSLSSELESCVKLFGFTELDLQQCILNAARSSFYDSFLQKELTENLQIELDKILS